MTEPSYELAHALWCEMPSEVQDATEVPAIREWLRRAMAVTAGCGPPVDETGQPTYRVGRHNPRNLYRRDEHMGVVFDPADGPRIVAALNAVEQPGNPYAGKSLAELEQVMQSDEYRRPLLEGYVLPDVTSYLTKAMTDLGILPVPYLGPALAPLGTPAPSITWAGVKATMDRIMGADHYGTRPPFDVQVKGMLMDAYVDRAVHGDRTVPDGPRGLLAGGPAQQCGSCGAWFDPPAVHACDQCPTCTSPYRHHRFELPRPFGNSEVHCDDDWHEATQTDDTAHTCPGLLDNVGEFHPAPCGRDMPHDPHPLGVTPPNETLPAAVEGDTTERTWSPAPMCRLNDSAERITTDIRCPDHPLWEPMHYIPAMGHYECHSGWHGSGNGREGLTPCTQQTKTEDVT